jgi:phospholipid/cholesterol/gamma-HCH transport system permease protein
MTSAERGLSSTGDLVRFGAFVLRDVLSLRVLRYFGEALRQAGILIVSSGLVIVALMFTIGITCGTEGAFFSRSTGSPPFAGVFTSICDLREAAPLAFGYIMSAKVGTGLVAEIGAMRVNEEVDALDAMGVDSLTFLCATRLLAAWLVIPFLYCFGIGASFVASWLAVVKVVGDTTSGGYDLIFWFFQNPLDVLFSLIKAFAMATLIVIVGGYFGYTVRGGPTGVGAGAAKSMVVNIVGVHVISMVGTQLFWGSNPRAPIGG